MIPEMMSIKNTCYLYVFGLLKEIENFFLTLLQCELFLKKILITYVIKITSQDPKCFKLSSTSLLRAPGDAAKFPILQTCSLHTERGKG